ncbi:MAG: heme lyase CcmF/NrfE family subunit [Actinomycetota bacterium]|nr:heme lyase CcmF/NrfE family subunit [Actinomycetota bacterium]
MTLSLGGLGRPSLVAAFLLMGLAVALSLWGALRRDVRAAEAGRRALTAAAAFVALAAVALVSALFAHDFSLEYVTNYSSRALSRGYTMAALWGGMEGSLLFWTVLLSLFAAVALRRPEGNTAIRAWATLVLGGISLFFLLLLLFPASPFRVLAQVPADGNGLNPLLQSPGMLIHPPLLYTGFVAFSIPFAFGMGALATKRLDETWLKQTRRWTLFAWSALSIGIVLGGAWAYTELGWGGYWAWDPVENASFMPWLTATAYLHSVVIQEKRRMFKVWNLSLILLTYVLAVFGTFLTRSGILSSIHTFTEGPIGKWFLPFLAAMLIGGLAMIASRLDSLKSENRFDALLSRESAFLANNVLFLAAAFAVLWGTIYPIVMEAVSGVRVAVGPPFFNAVFIPIGLALVGLTGLGPLIAWRRMNKRAFFRMVRVPLLAGATAVLAPAAAGIRSTGALLAFGLCAFTFTAIVAEFARGARVHRSRDGLGWPSAIGRTLMRNRRRYGGYVVHLGVVLIVLGFAGSAFRVERSAHLEQGQTMQVGDYTLRYEEGVRGETPEKEIFQANISAARDGEMVETLEPQRNLHIVQQQFQSEVAIASGPVEDLYVVVTAVDPDGGASVRAFVNPLTWWIWAGAGLMAVGMSLLLSEGTPRPALAAAPSRVARPAVATR